MEAEKENTIMSREIGEKNEAPQPIDSFRHIAHIGQPSDIAAVKALLHNTGSPLYASDMASVHHHSSGSQVVAVNLIHDALDSFGDVNPSLRLCDGAIVTASCVAGLRAKAEVALTQALAERIKPALMITDLDVAALRDPEEAYQGCLRVLAEVNETIERHTDPLTAGFVLGPADGPVIFGSLKQGWAFTLGQFARRYAAKFGCDEAKMCGRLWGNNYFDGKARRWVTTGFDADGGTLRRAFCQFCLEPIYQLSDAALGGKADKLHKMLAALGIDLSDAELSMPNRADTIAIVMKKFLPFTDTVLGVASAHLPSPRVAQPYRAELLLKSSRWQLSDNAELLKAVAECDGNPAGPLMMLVSRLVSVGGSSPGQLFAFGRVFSGEVRPGKLVTVRTGDHISSAKPIAGCSSMASGAEEEGQRMAAGHLCIVNGLDTYILATAILTDEANPPKGKNSNVYKEDVRIVNLTVEVISASDLPQLVEGMKRLVITEPLVACFMNYEGETVMAASNEFKLRRFLSLLRDKILGGLVPLKASQPYVSYREGITAPSSILCLSKSPNKHNRVYCRAEPLSEDVMSAIERGEVSSNPQDRASTLTALGFDREVSRKVWCFGPEADGPNLLVDQTKGVQYLHELADSIQAGFQGAVTEGPLCGEPLRGVQINLEDVVYYADAIHRSSSQLIPAAKRVVMACFLTAQPRLLEPYGQFEIVGISALDVAAVKKCIASRLGVIESEDEGAFRGEFGINLRVCAPLCEFSRLQHGLNFIRSSLELCLYLSPIWRPIEGDPLQIDSPAGKVMMEVRARKGLKYAPPNLDDYLDKL